MQADATLAAIADGHQARLQLEQEIKEARQQLKQVQHDTELQLSTLEDGRKQVHGKLGAYL